MTHAIGQLPAYPVPANSVNVGIARRDWFAAIALQGLAAKGLEVSEDRVLSEDEKNRILCTRAYALADTMVAVSAETSKRRELRRKVVRRKRAAEGAKPAAPSTEETASRDPVAELAAKYGLSLAPNPAPAKKSNAGAGKNEDAASTQDETA